MKIGAFATLGVVLWPHAVHSLDGKELLKTCTNLDIASQNFCIGYITGIVDTLTSNSGSSSRLICIPSVGGRPDQLHRQIVKYLRDHPESRLDGADTLVALALSDSIPCKEKQ